MPEYTGCSITFSLPLLGAEEIKRRITLGDITVDHVLTVCTSGRSNWIERGIHMADVLGYVALPEQIDLPDDTEEYGGEMELS